MKREKLNRWGDPEEIDPADLPVDQWFPSERDHQSPGMELLSRSYAPFGALAGIVLAGVTFVLLRMAFLSDEISMAVVLLGSATGALAIIFLVSYGTLGYYAIKRHVLSRRRDRRLPIDMDPDDIDDYSVPLFYVPGTGELMMKPLSSGGKTMPLGMKRARIVTYVAAGVFAAAILALGLLSAAGGGPS